MNECGSALTDYARTVLRHDYVYFGVENCAAGFFHDASAALRGCDIHLDAGDSVPCGFTGQVAFVTDHGNLTVQRFSRGRMTRELFAVV